MVMNLVMNLLGISFMSVAYMLGIDPEIPIELSMSFAMTALVCSVVSFFYICPSED